MKSIAVIGAGVTGLTAAFTLQDLGFKVCLYEASDRAGGVIRTVRRDGFLAECGPNTLLETSPEIPQLFRDLGIERDALYSDPAAKNKYVIRGGKPVPMPSSAPGFFGCRLFSTHAKLRLLREPFIPRSNSDVEESLAAFVVRRLGQEFLDYAIDPLAAGVYAGDPWKLSVREAFGKVYELEQRYGSLIRGQIQGAWKRKKRRTVSKQNAPKVSFRYGLSTLTDALAAELGSNIRFGHILDGLAQVGDEWQVDVVTEGKRESVRHSAVLNTLPANRLASLDLRTRVGASFSFLRDIRYSPVSSVVLGFKRDAIKHPLDGFGFLVPGVEHFNILGAIFSSSLFPNRAPEGYATITCYLGGMRNPGLPFANSSTQVALAVEDLNRALGISSPPVFSHHVVYPNAIPQYELGYSRIREQIEAIERNCPGLYFGGNYYHGVSLSDSILNGIALGRRIAHEAAHRPNEEHAAAA